MPPFTHSTGSSSLHVSHFQSEPLLTEQDSSERRWHHESEDICSSPKSSSYGSVFLRWHRRLVLWLRITGRDNEQKGDLEHGEASSCRRQLVGKALCLCRRSRRVRYILLVILSIFIMLGFIQSITLFHGVFLSFFPSYIDETVDRWGVAGEPGEYLAHWPTDATAGIIPVACHSHNDYWRRVPLYSAIQVGCIGVEADVWLFDDNLYVGHTKSSLAINRTLTSLYIDPLVNLLEKQNPITQFQPSRHSIPNGVFDSEPYQTLVLLVDFKTNGHDIWPYLVSQLSPLRDRGYLTHFNGTAVVERPVTIVATGNAPYELVIANSTYRDIFFDAPLDNLTVPASNSSNTDTDNSTIFVPYDYTNSYYASVSFRKSIGFPWRFKLSTKQRHLIKTQIKSAHERGLRARYWNTPDWPHSLRNQIWTDLVREGVDILNVDDLKSVAKKDWAGV